jgi:hypothetical protein
LGVLLQHANYLIENALHRARPALAKAIEACRAFNAKLVIAKFGRLSRDAHFLLGLEKAGIEFVASSPQLQQMLSDMTSEYGVL